jgi:hypothetical protein
MFGVMAIPSGEQEYNSFTQKHFQPYHTKNITPTQGETALFFKGKASHVRGKPGRAVHTQDKMFEFFLISLPFLLWP